MKVEEKDMKKSNLIKVCSILVIAIMVALIFSTTVNAANDTNESFTDMTNSLRSGNTNTGNTNTNTNTNNSNTNTNNANRANTNTNSNNASVYNSNNLPDTGIESSIPIALLVVIFAISSVYAYKKINDYKNI